MASSVRNRIRIAQSQKQVVLLGEDIERWRGRRSSRDPRGQYSTQLRALTTTLQTAIEVIRQRGAAVTEGDSIGRVFSHCQKVDQGLLEIRTLWSYFRERLDQRDDPEWGPLLEAADEVVWSLWAPVWRRCGDRSVPPAPLPYVESHFSPRAIPRDRPPRELAGFGNLAAELKSLPMPLVALPPSCVEEPWQLIFLGHEVGHHLQYELLPSWALVSRFRDLLRQTVRSAGPPGAQREDRWGRWGLEVFADACSVLQLGPWATWSLSDLVMQEERGLLLDQAQYPSPVVRLSTMAALYALLARGPVALDSGWSQAPELRCLEPESLTRGDSLPLGSRDLRVEARCDLDLVPDLVRQMAVASFESLGTLPSLIGFEARSFAPRGKVDRWKAEFLRRTSPPPPVREVDAARQAVAGGLAAWAEVSGDADDGRRSAHRDQLRETLPATLAACFEPGVRAASGATGSAVELGEGLGQRLWAGGATVLEGSLREREE